MTYVFVRFPVDGNKIEEAKILINNLLKNHFPELDFKIDGAIVLKEVK